MNWLDIVILIPLLAGTYSGFRNGLARGVIVLVGVIAGIIIAGQSYEMVADSLGIFDNQRVQEAAAFAVVVAVVVLVFWLAGWMFRKMLSLLMLGWVDRVGGAAVGAIVGLLFGASVVWAVGLIPGSAGVDAIAESVLATAVVDGSDSIRAILPSAFDEVRAAVDAAADR